MLVDAHVHVGLESPDHATMLSTELDRLDMGMFHCGLDPRTWKDDRDSLGTIPRVRVGAGLHPWWVQTDDPLRKGCGDSEAQLLQHLCYETRYIGEIGLDFGRKTRDEVRRPQLDYFEHVCQAATDASRQTGVPRVLSIHAVRSASPVLDILQKTGAIHACHCIFHWFSGNTDELWRAIRAGCWFSLNTFGLATGKGREYAKLIPAQRLLTETDHEVVLKEPEQVLHLKHTLEHAIELIAAARRTDVAELRELIGANAHELLFA